MADNPPVDRKPRHRPPLSTRPKRRPLFHILGPGLITGASDDDPSGIATYSQVGAQFGFAMGWAMLFSFPLMAAIQEVSARIGRVTGHGIAGNMRRHYPPALLRAVVTLLLVANVINLGADLGAVGDVIALLAGGPRPFYVVFFGVLCVWLEIFMRYRRYVDLLKWTSAALLSYAVAAFAVHVPWREALADTLLPTFRFTAAYAVAVVAVFGTTISPYLFFWQSSQEAEDERVDRRARPLLRAPQQAPREFARIRLDTYVGMFFSNLIGWFIIVTVAATLHAQGITDIATSAQAAEALRPIAGPFAYTLFALGVVGTGLLAVPVLAGSVAYAVGEALRWPTGLARRPIRAKAFYATIVVATLVGAALNFTAIDPIKALFWSAVLNGIVAVPVMAVTMTMARQPKVMGAFVLPLPLTLMGWLATAVMAAVVAAMFLTWGG
jgi:NRAMP (natural resistance-associated macrophage protein)-like metal ion transporter